MTIRPFPFTTAYFDGTVFLQMSRYTIDGSRSLDVIDATGDQELVLCATICLASEGYVPEPGNVVIKDWSENSGTLAGLISAGIIGEPIRELPVGRHSATAYECPLLVAEDDPRIQSL